MATDKTLKAKAIKIKGKDYVLVADRVTYFNETYPNGSIHTQLISAPESNIVVVKAMVCPDLDMSERYFCDYSQAVKGDGMINKTAALENACTSAVGRALALMGIGVIDSIASVDEIHKAQTNVSGPNPKTRYATIPQIKLMRSIASQVTGLEEAKDIDAWIKETLGDAPNMVPIYKVDEAIRKINEQRENKSSDDSDLVADVTDDDLSAFDKNEIPF